MNSFKKLGLLLILIVFLAGCRRDNTDIPYVSFDFTININEPSFFDLQVVGGHETVVGGSLGIIIYRSNFDQFVALERHSPYNVEENCQVSVTEDDITIEDPCSGSQWVITDGSIISGPTSQGLLQYKTVFNNPYLRVYN